MAAAAQVAGVSRLFGTVRLVERLAGVCSVSMLDKAGCFLVKVVVRRAGEEKVWSLAGVFFFFFLIGLVCLFILLVNG